MKLESIEKRYFEKLDSKLQSLDNLFNKSEIFKNSCNSIKEQFLIMSNTIYSNENKDNDLKSCQFNVQLESEINNQFTNLENNKTTYNSEIINNPKKEKLLIQVKWYILYEIKQNDDSSINSFSKNSAKNKSRQQSDTFKKEKFDFQSIDLNNNFYSNSTNLENSFAELGEENRSEKRDDLKNLNNRIEKRSEKLQRDDSDESFYLKEINSRKRSFKIKRKIELIQLFTKNGKC